MKHNNNNNIIIIIIIIIITTPRKNIWSYTFPKIDDSRNFGSKDNVFRRYFFARLVGILLK